MIKRLPLVFTAIVFAAATLIAAEVSTVKLKSGREITGEVTKGDSTYKIKTLSGQTVTVLVSQVDSVSAPIDPDKEYADRLSKIDAKSADDHVTIAEWASANNLFEIAQKELKAALDINKDHVKARLLLRKVEAAIADAATPVETKPAPTATPTGTPTGTPTIGTETDKTFIPTEDIYRIRLQELRRDDKDVAVEFKNDVLERFITMMEGSEPDFKDQAAINRFRAMPRALQALRIRKEFERRDDAAKWYDDIIVKSDPKFMSDYRTKVWPVLRSQCASVDCHGGDKVNGRLKLFCGVSNERVDYTNFVILDGFKTADGRMFDRDTPEDSLLLQFGLPKEQSNQRHPKTIKVVFPNRRSQQYKDIEDFMSKLRPTPHPDYRLKWAPPAPMHLDFGGINFEPASKPTSARSEK